jgi:hypothetical protein
MPISALGQKRTFQNVRPMSVLPPKADIAEQRSMSALCQKRTWDNGPDIAASMRSLVGYERYCPPMLGSDGQATGDGFHLPVSASDLGP